MAILCLHRLREKKWKLQMRTGFSAKHFKAVNKLTKLLKVKSERVQEPEGAQRGMSMVVENDKEKSLAPTDAVPASPHVAVARTYLDVYLIYPISSLMRRTATIPNISDLELDNPHMYAHPVFLQRYHAQNYTRFLNGRFLILVAQVPESDIQADSTRLMIRGSRLKPSQVRGIIPAWRECAEMQPCQNFKPA